MKVFLYFAFLLVFSEAFVMHSSFSTRVTRSKQEKKLCEIVVKKYGKKFEDTPTKFIYYDLHLALKTKYVVQYCKYIKFEWGISWRKQEAEYWHNYKWSNEHFTHQFQRTKTFLFIFSVSLFLLSAIAWLLENQVMLAWIWKLIM